MAQYLTITTLLLSSILIKSSSATDNQEYVITVQDTEEGLKVTLIPSTTPDQGGKMPAFETKTFSGHRLSSDCGHQYVRCRPLIFTTTVNTLETAEHALFVPLQNGLLLLNVSNFGENSRLEIGAFHIIANTMCSPTTIFKLYSSFYTMCTDLQNQYISLYEVRLNSTSLEHSLLYGPLTELSSIDLVGFSSSDVVNMSNFLLDLDIPHQPLIYFAIDNYLFTIDLVDRLFYDSFNSLGLNCRRVKQLIKASSSQLLIYCAESYVYYNVEVQDWTSEQTYSSSGVPYLCPDQNYQVIVHDRYLEYRIGSRQGTVSDVDFDNGLCFNTSLDKIFVYADKTMNSVQFINLTSGNQNLMLRMSQPLSVECSSTVDCIPIIYLSDRYLVIQQTQGDESITVLDTYNDYRVVVSVDHQAPSLVFVVLGASQNLPTRLPSSTSPSTTFTVITDGVIDFPIVTIIIAITTLLLLASVIILMVVIIFMRWKGMMCSMRHVHDIADIESNQPDIATVQYNIVYPQQEQEPTSSPESNHGRDENRMLQPSTNDGYRDFLEEGKGDEKLKPAVDVPSHNIIAVPDRVHCPQDNDASLKEFDANVSHADSDRQPLLK